MLPEETKQRACGEPPLWQLCQSAQVPVLKADDLAARRLFNFVEPHKIILGSEQTASGLGLKRGPN